MTLGWGGEWGQGLLSAILRRKQPASRSAGHLSPQEIVRALYRGLLDREPDPAGFAVNLGAFRSGTMLEHALRSFLAGPEFQARMLRTLVPTVELPDLTRLMPERYETPEGGCPLLYVAREDADIERMESLIRQHRYYDRFDVWSPVIDPDKRIIAAVARGLRAKTCFELGCFTGPVLSVLAESGVSVAGCDTSHHAFAFAYPNVRGHMIYGDLLEIELDRKFDVIVCMDVLEHLSPLRLDRYIAKLVSLLEDHGRIYLNSPMWGRDEVFGIAAEPIIAAWRTAGDGRFWREWPCDEAGWPQHGHLIWASPNWWMSQFAAHGLQRDVALERVIHYQLSAFFDREPGRRSLFVLRHPNAPPSSAADAETLAASLAAEAELAH